MSPSSLSHMSQVFIHFLAFFVSLQSLFLHFVFFVSLHVLPPLSSLPPSSLSPSPMSPSSLSSSHMSQVFIHFLAFFVSLQSLFLHCVFFVSLHVLPPLSSLSPSSLSHMSQYFIHFLAFLSSLQSLFLHC